LSIIAILIVAFISGGCDLFHVKDLNALNADQLKEKGNINALSKTAEGSLSLAYGTVALVGGVPSDGILVASTSQDGSNFVDTGLFDGNYTFIGNMWNLLSSATWAGVRAKKTLEGLVDNPTSNIKIAKSTFWIAIDRVTEADFFKEIPFNGGVPK